MKSDNFGVNLFCLQLVIRLDLQFEAVFVFKKFIEDALLHVGYEHADKLRLELFSAI